MKLFQISNEIREKSAAEIRPVFDRFLVKTLSDRRAVLVDQPFNYSYFKNASIEHLNIRFIRYFFARVDSFLADGMKVGMKHPMADLVTKRGDVNGFHVEHILSRNDDNFALFNNDKEKFEQERNRLGGILLLKGKDNISSSNEIYNQKLKTYANTLYWTETLAAVSLTTLSLGVIKSVFFGAAIAICGCMQGLLAGNSTAAVGQATTRAVVAAITAVIVLDSAFAVIFTLLDI